MNPVFRPALRNGLILHLTAALLLLTASAVCFAFGILERGGAVFIILLLAAVALIFPIISVVYSAYALAQASYTLDRDGLRLRWGLRSEDIPLPQIEWVRPVTDLTFDLKPPFWHWPGSITGVIRVEGLGPIEFMAADTRSLLLVATPERIYAISPADPAAFLLRFRRMFELGSLAPINSYSTQPVSFLSRVWSDRAARLFLLTGATAGVILFIMVSILIPGRATVTMGYTGALLPNPPVPAEQLLLFPFYALLTLLLDVVLGLFFYRREDQRPAAYLIWASGGLTPLLLLGAVWLIR